MKTNIVLIAGLMLAMALSASGDSLKFTRIPGMPPPGMSAAQTNLGIVEGGEFNKIKPQIEAIIATLIEHAKWVPKEATWWDVGPDAGYVSAVIELRGKTYTINSWYPTVRESPRVAATEKGLVVVKTKAEKEELESKNSAAYQQIVSIFGFMPQPKRQ